MYRAAYNATGGPIVADWAGRTIGDTEFGIINDQCDGVRQALATGQLIYQADDLKAGPGVNEQASAATGRLKEIRRRETALEGLDDDAVRAQLTSDGREASEAELALEGDELRDYVILNPEVVVPNKTKAEKESA